MQNLSSCMSVSCCLRKRSCCHFKFCLRQVFEKLRFFHCLAMACVEWQAHARRMPAQAGRSIMFTSQCQVEHTPIAKVFELGWRTVAGPLKRLSVLWLCRYLVCSFCIPVRRPKRPGPSNRKLDVAVLSRSSTVIFPSSWIEARDSLQRLQICVFRLSPEQRLSPEHPTFHPQPQRPCSKCPQLIDYSRRAWLSLLIRSCVSLLRGCRHWVTSLLESEASPNLQSCGPEMRPEVLS